MEKPNQGLGLNLLSWARTIFPFMLLLVAGRWAHAQSADCGHPDPTNFDQVFACMSSLHFGGQGQGPNVFVQSGITSCSAAAHQYSSALRKSRVSPQEIPDLIPSCDVLAKGMAQLKGAPPAWSACTDYPGHFDAAHMKACLDRFLPGYYGGRRSLQSLNGCADATQQYELALKAATIAKDRTMSVILPEGYQKPDCAVVAGMIGKGSACLNYEPSAGHVQQCLGADFVHYPSCIAMRQVYETKLRQAYGGGFPPNYAALTCDQLAGLVGQATAVQAQIRAQQVEQQQRNAAEAQRRRNEARNLGGLGGLFGAGFAGGGLIGWLWGFLGAPFLWGAIVHGAVVIGSLLYASRQARSGRWVHVVSMLSGVFTRAFSLTMMGVHGALIAIGIALTGWPWVAGAVLAIIFGKVAAVAMWMFGMFRNPPVAVGKVDRTGAVVQKPEPPPAKDPHRTPDWTDPTRTDDWQ
jgi:hypothetical protein